MSEAGSSTIPHIRGVQRGAAARHGHAVRRWMCLHHYHGDVWDRIADTDPYRNLVRTAYRSWTIDADHEPSPPDT